jgi:salicylate hydroxylase
MPMHITSSQSGNMYNSKSNGCKNLSNGHGSIEPLNFAHGARSLPDWTSSYPSQSLRFLEELAKGDASSHHQVLLIKSKPELAQLRLNIIIVGAGLGGLALAIALSRRGHVVRVLEQAAKLGEVC